MNASVSSDRNLLFGLLALQMEFVTQPQLIEAMHAWMLQKETPLGEILCQRGFIDDDDRADVEKLLARHLRRHGDARASLASVRVGGEVRASLAALGDADVQASLAPRPADDSTPATLPPRITPPDSIPSGMRYRRLHLHARGGLGEVHLARDEELGREVALKEIQGPYADDPDSRARFLREAEITGHLEHPGIVPVYGMGCHADGRPFYAMRFIRGESMQEAIARFHKADEEVRRDPGERSLALRALLGRFVAVCEAVAFAHSRGVIHRDLKPANVMLGEYGETLVVDWGLARLVGQADPEATTAERPLGLAQDGATQPGEVVGTLAYLPPEQARGLHGEVGPVSDVFSLGAVLYAILTGRPPYKADSVEETLRLARAGEVPLARRWKPGVPEALEAVSARAMRFAPQDRYAGAPELAQEVLRWLADEPVKAYREPLGDRARRWRRRHRTLVSVGVALLLAGVVALGVGLQFVDAERARALKAEGRERQRRAEAESNLKRALEAEAEAKDNLKLAKENLKLGREAIDECFNVAKTDPVFQGPRMEKARNLLLRKTLRFYRDFRARLPGDGQLRREEAEQWARVGNVEQVLGRREEAREAYQKATRYYLALSEADPGAPDLRQTLALTHGNLGLLLDDLGQREAALKEYRRASDLQHELVRQHPTVAVYRHDLSRTHSNRGNLFIDLGRHDEALRDFRFACEQQARLVEANPDEAEYLDLLAAAHNNLGNLFKGLGKPAEALAEYEQARKLKGKLVAAYPGEPEYRNGLAVTRNNVAAVLVGQGKREKALLEFQKACELQREVVRVHRDVPGYRNDLARTHNNLASVLAEMGQREEALLEFRKACDLRVELFEAHPGVSEYAEALAGTYHNRGQLLGEAKRDKEAVEEYRLANELRLNLVKTNPNVPRYREDLNRTQSNFAQACRRLAAQFHAAGESEAALREHRSARDLHSQLAARDPKAANRRVALAEVCFATASLLLDLKRSAEALEEADDGLAEIETLKKIDPKHPAIAGHQLSGTFLRAAALSRLGRHQEADADWERALELAPRAVRLQLHQVRAESRAHAGDYLRSAEEVTGLLAKAEWSGPYLYLFARSQALNAHHAARDAGRPLAEREKRAESYAREALALLERTADAGLFRRAENVGHLKKTPDLDFLRGRDDFDRFVARCEKQLK